MIITDNSFQEFIDQKGFTLVDFWAEWCGPCRAVAPILEEISNEYNLPVGKLNVDENPLKSEEYSVNSIPTMVLFENGVSVKTITGAMPKHKLLKELDQWI